MLELDKVDRAEFEAHLGEEFRLVYPDGVLPIRLTEARSLGMRAANSIRDPFALTFRTAPNLRIKQHIYRVEHDSLGDMEIFLVQVSADSKGTSLEAIFN